LSFDEKHLKVKFQYLSENMETLVKSVKYNVSERVGELLRDAGYMSEPRIEEIVSNAISSSFTVGGQHVLSEEFMKQLRHECLEDIRGLSGIETWEYGGVTFYGSKDGHKNFSSRKRLGRFM